MTWTRLIRRTGLQCRGKGTWSFSSAQETVHRIAETPVAKPFDILEGKRAQLHAFFHNESSTWQYIVRSKATDEAAIVDVALDLNGTTGRLGTQTADSLLKYVDSNAWSLTRIFETHIHADHATAALYSQFAWGAMHEGAQRVNLGIGNTVGVVQDRIAEVYGIEGASKDLFDDLWDDGAEFSIGDIPVRVLHVPGHTPDHIAYVIDDEFALVGDTLFQPDMGTARADFPGGSAVDLYNSSRRLLDLGEETLICVGHDYPGDRREKAFGATVKEHRATNKHMHDGVTLDEFVKMRSERDKALAQPALLHASMQVNGLAGDLPTVGKRKGFMTPIR